MKNLISKDGSNLLHAIFNSMNGGLIIIDEASIIQYVNPRSEKMFGYQDGELEGKNLSILMPEHHRKHHPQYVENSSISGENIIMGEGRELLGLRKDGSQFPFEISLGNYEQDGKRYISAVVRDVTKAREDENRLLEAIKTAKLASSAKSDFLSMMSHEIRTPMNGVMGMISLLKQTKLSDDQIEYVELAYNSAGMLVSILNDILDLAKIESGKIDLEKISFNFQSLVEDVLELFVMNANEKGIELAIIPSSNPLSNFIGDQTRLHQILTNLVGNAIKFTEEGSVSIKYNIREITADNTHAMLEVEVTDTGIGIPKDQQQIIFNPFTQADSSVTRKHGGTGLGLTIINKLLLAMNSKITLESTPDKGTTFRFDLELQVDQECAKQENKTRSLLTDKQALIITPRQSLFSQSLAGFLGRHKLDMNCLPREELLKSLSDNSLLESSLFKNTDLLILDLYTNDTEIINFLKKLHSNEKLGAIPWLFATPHGLNLGDILDKNIHPFYKIIHKPLRESTLCKELENSFACRHPQKNQTDTANQLVTNNKNIKALLVDDTETNLRVAKLFLEKLGIATDTAVNGLEALQLIEQNSYDLVFMDCRMPEMDGYEATRRIRALPGSNQTVPIIALTAQVEAESQKKCTESGMNDFLAKPFEFNAIKNIVQKWMPHDHEKSA